MKNTVTTLIDSAKQYARETIHETWPTAKEVSQPTASMYEFDAILIDDEACSIASVSIMHNPDADTFALVENVRMKLVLEETESASMPAPHFDEPIDWDKLAEGHAIAYLHGDLATSSPESYSIEEMKAISDGMFASTAEAEAAMRKDFESMPNREKMMLLDMLGAPESNERKWWESILLGFDSIPDTPPNRV